MAREVNAVTGNYFGDGDQLLDLQQSVYDRLLTPVGSRALYPDYGFSQSWPQWPEPELRRRIIAALQGDPLADRFSFSRDGLALVVDLISEREESY